MRFLKLFFDALVVIGLILLVARLVSFGLQALNIPFTTIFTDYSIPSLAILLVGALGNWILNKQKRP
ncbi:hypothetical protein HCB37_12190 [Listeria booriae]|uniref:hypothetical protein n=1 Tax=Listeria booriae TaxID=1552123 RepID=UPI0016274A3C|nr:hypothetical protein [Listeria booriae]MBC2265267.1 hypothetical protein [Listeria booriae]